MRFRRVLAFTTLVVSVACGDATEDAGYSADGSLLEVERELRIDGHEADLVPVTWLGVSPAGNIALIQWQDHNVRFFDPSGAPIGSFGSDGEGPGEFRRPIRGGWLGDTLWVSDTQLNRVTLIGPGLELAGTLTPPPIIRSVEPGAAEREFALSVPYAILAHDTLLVTSLRQLNGPEFNEDTGFPILRTTAAGVLVNEAAWLPMDEGAGVSVPVDRGVAYGQVPFYTQPDWAVAADGTRLAILTHETAEGGDSFYHVRVFDYTGRQLVDRRFPFDPVPIPQSRMDSAIAATAARRPAIRGPMERALRDAAPSTFPAAERVLVARDHRIWVGLRRVDLGQEWLVLDETGETVAKVMLPPGAVLHEADATHLWTVERDEFDVESVVRYRTIERVP